MTTQSYEQSGGFDPEKLQTQSSQFPQHGATQAGRAYEQIQGGGSEGHKAMNAVQGYRPQTTTQGENFGEQAPMNSAQGYGEQAMMQGRGYEGQQPMNVAHGFGNEGQEYGHQTHGYQGQSDFQQQPQYQQNQGGYQGEQGGYHGGQSGTQQQQSYQQNQGGYQGEQGRYQGGQSGTQQQQSYQQTNGAGGPAQNPEQQDMITKILVRLEKKFGGERFTNPDNDAKNKAMNANIVKKISYGIKLIMQKAPGYAMKYLH